MKNFFPLYQLKKYIENNGTQKAHRILKENHFFPISATEPEDIFVAGFPKSGNTWMQNLIAGVLYGISTEYLPDSLTQELVPDVHYKKFYKRFSNFTCFKTHQLPQEHMKKVIHLIRDPRDVIVSYFHFKTSLGQKIELDQMITDSEGILHQWKKHSISWNENPFQAEKIVVRYEDLVKDAFKQVLRMVVFMNLDRSDALIKKAVLGNTFTRMQLKEDTLGLENSWNKVIMNSGSRFFRKGKVNGYKEELSQDLTYFIEMTVGEEMEIYSYKKEYY